MYCGQCKKCGSGLVGHNTGTGAIDAPIPWCRVCAETAAQLRRAQRQMEIGIAVFVCLVVAAPSLFWRSAAAGVFYRWTVAVTGSVVAVVGALMLWWTWLHRLADRASNRMSRCVSYHYEMPDEERRAMRVEYDRHRSRAFDLYWRRRNLLPGFVLAALALLSAGAGLAIVSYATRLR